MMQSALYIGRVRHTRHRPVVHDFSYPVRLLWIDLAELDTVFRGRWLWSTRRANLAWFRRSDYLAPHDAPLADAVRQCVASRTGIVPAGPVRVLTQARLYGSCFNPVTFYYCYHADGHNVQAVIAEITNTPWNERAQYVVLADSAASGGRAVDGTFEKTFHVSPFMPMDLDYAWTFGEPGEHLRVGMVNRHAGDVLFNAYLDLRRVAMTGSQLARTLIAVPASGVGVLARIYWQALRLRLKGAPTYAHP
ncbi:MAG: DUF1365 domain-containing protein [Steroidobacteraceae bacterium]